MGKNPWIAAFLSFLVAGLGQLYVGRFRRGAVFFLLELATAYLYWDVHELVGGVLNLTVGLLAIIDAFRLAKQAPVRKTEPRKPDRQYRVF